MKQLHKDIIFGSYLLGTYCFAIAMLFEFLAGPHRWAIEWVAPGVFRLDTDPYTFFEVAARFDGCIMEMYFSGLKIPGHMVVVLLLLGPAVWTLYQSQKEYPLNKEAEEE